MLCEIIYQHHPKSVRIITKWRLTASEVNISVRSGPLRSIFSFSLGKGVNIYYCDLNVVGFFLLPSQLLKFNFWLSLAGRLDSNKRGNLVSLAMWQPQQLPLWTPNEPLLYPGSITSWSWPSWLPKWWEIMFCCLWTVCIQTFALAVWTHWGRRGVQWSSLPTTFSAFPLPGSQSEEWGLMPNCGQCSDSDKWHKKNTQYVICKWPTFYYERDQFIDWVLCWLK